MRIQRISTATEAMGTGILRRTFAGYPVVIAPRVSIQSVIAKDEGLSDRAFSLLTRGHFDCVVCFEDSGEPIFAVEFDGAGHDKPAQIERDRLKNLFCMLAGLPLLRLGTAELISPGRMSVLEWLAQALIDELAHDADDDAVNPGPVGEGEVDFARADEGFTLDEDGPAFESEHPFPANEELVGRLLSQHDISIGSPLIQTGTLPKVVMDSSQGKSRYVLSVDWPGRQRIESGDASEFVSSERDFTVHDRARIVLKGCGRGRFAWAHRLPEASHVRDVLPNVRLTAEQIRYRRAKGLCPTDIGWWESTGVARELALCDALSQVERWARGAKPPRAKAN